ncbi:hypothetical protein [Pelagibacterium luteolum]|uniref:Uncharacterized protein n=1 Tax=Pelagibacterium luteolum TaxID=440168 RepID=A0A1G7XVN6_9HYPH|nr:hypothetical protein [Pelagibacterium luteolum]SDG88096.1 hypothetical protein SAMN04487974_11120 [Pelagibacterium luteolum]
MDMERIRFTRPPLWWRLANANAALEGTVTSRPLPAPEMGRTDPAALIALAVRHQAIGAVDGAPIPNFIRAGLREHADHGHLGARTTLDWLDECLSGQLETPGE